jgi:hypothetical protein
LLENSSCSRQSRSQASDRNAISLSSSLVFLFVFYIIDTMEDQKDINLKKTEKLVTAIFMVTDLMEKAEPIRRELRASSLKLLSERNNLLVSHIMSLINISSSIGLISDMNGNILAKELSVIKNSILNLERFNFSTELISRTFQGHNQIDMPKQNNNVLYKTKSPFAQPKKEVKLLSVTKNDRRESILNLIKNKKEVTIKDISSNISDCSEKTIQRELVLLLKDKVIDKAGEKRWSRYFIAK